MTDTRTQETRDAYRARVLTYLQLHPGPCSTGDVFADIGGTTQHVRTAMAELVASGIVTRTGKTRNTRYTLNVDEATAA